MNTLLYFTTPVQAVKVSPHNLQEIADWCGGRVCLSGKEDAPNYVWVPTPKGSNVYAAYPGMYVTKKVHINTKGEPKVSWAVFYREYFEKNYFVNPVTAIDARETAEALVRGSSRPVEGVEVYSVPPGRVSSENT